MRLGLLFCLTSLLVFPKWIHAQVIISEVYPTPLSGESEWIELVNIGTESVDISGWQLWDQLASPSLLHTVPPGTTLEAKSFFLVTLPIHKLNNSGDAVLLYSKTGAIVDEIWFASTSSGKSWQRTSVASTQFVWTNSTPGIENQTYPLLSAPIALETASTPTPATPLAPHITLTEFSACPAGGNEWVELYNTGELIVLSNWVIRDEVGNQRKISGELPPFAFTRFEWSGSILKNSGDSFMLKTDTGEVIGMAAYDSCQTGSTHVFDGTIWIQVIADVATFVDTTVKTTAVGTVTEAQKANHAATITETTAESSTTAASRTITSLPPVSPLKPERLITNAAKKTKVIEMPVLTIPYGPLLSVIIGGFCILLPGALTLYGIRRHSPPL